MGRSKIFGVIGNPILHSKSPQMHNAAFQAIGIDAVYTRIAATSAKEIIDIVNEVGIEGLNITSPFKEEVFEVVTGFSDEAKEIGAINTITFKNGEAIGHNTDHLGVTGALESNGVKLKGTNAIVIGAGGAAKAAVFGLLQSGANVTIANRTVEKAEEIARRSGCDAISLKELQNKMKSADILVSCVSSSERIIAVEHLHDNLAVLDANYSVKTRLVSDAESSGCKVIDAKEWLLFQAVKAFEIFTGKPAPVEKMRDALAIAEPERKNIALIGFMGSGKTSCAKELATITGMRNIQVDVNIERKTGMKISEIFEKQGETKFRELENEELGKMNALTESIVDCGGGAVLNRTNVENIKNNCITVWLMASQKETGNRTRNDLSRPLLKKPNKEKIIADMLMERIPIYAKAADVLVYTDDKTPKQIVERIANETHRTM